MNGLITQTLDWILHPTYSDSDQLEWFGATVAVLIVAFLWTTVLRKIE